ncbi:unnamed protein product [Rhizophagus irregularis]|nr:unnamed protein product [Rhizophagus irregularis]
MNKCKKYDVSLIKVGKLDEELHFGAFRHFCSKTRFSGLLICGFNDKEINKRILDDIPFQLFTIIVGNLQIFIEMIGVSDQENLGYVDEVWKEVWKKIEVLQNWDGKTLFGINHEKTQNLVNILRTPSCTINEWNNEIMMTQLYKQHLYKFTPASIPCVGCTNITPFDKDKLDKEFWTKAENPIDDKHVLIYLYENNFLDMSLPDDNPNPIVNKFWSCFNESLKVNKKGIDGKRRILSIIADDFSYEEIRTNLLVAPTTIFDARKYARLNGPDAKQIEKPIRTFDGNSE